MALKIEGLQRFYDKIRDAFTEAWTGLFGVGSVPVTLNKAQITAVPRTRPYVVTVGQATDQVPFDPISTKGYKSFTAVFSPSGVSNGFWFEGGPTANGPWTEIVLFGYPFNNVSKFKADNSIPTNVWQNCNFPFIRLFREQTSPTQMNTVWLTLSEVPVLPQTALYGKWRYVNAAFTGTGATQLQAALSGSRKNAIYYFSVSNASSATGAAQFSILDGATVVFVKDIPAGRSIEFSDLVDMLEGTAGTAMSFSVSGTGHSLQIVIKGCIR